MTPIRPLHSSRVRPALIDRYALNDVCAHPECFEKNVTAHHVFGRLPGEHGDSWYVTIPMHSTAVDGVVKIVPATGEEDCPHDRECFSEQIVPAVTGLCGSGTTGHHGDLEHHESKIAFDEDGFYVWYDRLEGPGGEEYWNALGRLDPQPGPAAGKKRKHKPHEGGGAVKVASFKAPKDDPEAAQRIKDKTTDLLEKFQEAGHEIGRTVAVERALDYTLLNAGPEDY